MSKQIREVYGSVLAELGDTNENIVVLDADLSGSTKSALFGKAHPERFFNMGIAEQNMVATAAGMSTVGKIPFVNTFTVFLTSLGLLSARDQICYANLNVKFGGAYCGMSDALDGASHHGYSHHEGAAEHEGHRPRRRYRHPLGNEVRRGKLRADVPAPVPRCLPRPVRRGRKV